MEKIKIGVSRCLLGDKVRFDGQHKKDAFITGTLSNWCHFVPVCPEVECGLSVPRESMRLNQLAEEDLVAFIFKTKSPSSGMRNVKVYGPSGNIAGYNGKGLFARAYMNRFSGNSSGG